MEDVRSMVAMCTSALRLHSTMGPRGQSCVTQRHAPSARQRLPQALTTAGVCSMSSCSSLRSSAPSVASNGGSEAQ